MVYPPIPPKLFLCEKCQVYFWSFSKLIHPTHSKCHTHETRMCTPKEYSDIVNGSPKLMFPIKISGRQNNATNEC